MFLLLTRLLSINEFNRSIVHFWNDFDCIEDDDDEDQEWNINEDEAQGFYIQLRASMEDVKEGDAVNLTCETPPGKVFRQQWLHPQKQARTLSVLFFFSLSLPLFSSLFCTYLI